MNIIMCAFLRNLSQLYKIKETPSFYYLSVPELEMFQWPIYPFQELDVVIKKQQNSQNMFVIVNFYPWQFKSIFHNV